MEHEKHEFFTVKDLASVADITRDAMSKFLKRNKVEFVAKQGNAKLYSADTLELVKKHYAKKQVASDAGDITRDAESKVVVSKTAVEEPTKTDKKTPVQEITKTDKKTPVQEITKTDKKMPVKGVTKTDQKTFNQKLHAASFAETEGLEKKMRERAEDEAKAEQKAAEAETERQRTNELLQTILRKLDKLDELDSVLENQPLLYKKLNKLINALYSALTKQHNTLYQKLNTLAGHRKTLHKEVKK